MSKTFKDGMSRNKRRLFSRYHKESDSQAKLALYDAIHSIPVDAERYGNRREQEAYLKVKERQSRMRRGKGSKFDIGDYDDE